MKNTISNPHMNEIRGLKTREKLYDNQVGFFKLQRAYIADEQGSNVETYLLLAIPL